MPIKTWGDLKRELKGQFIPKNVEYNARRKLRELVQTGTMREFVRGFSTLMLDIRDMSEKDKMFYFLESLKPWARIELQRQRVQDVATAMAIAECLNDYSDGPSKRKTPPSNGSSSNFGNGGKPPGWIDPLVGEQIGDHLVETHPNQGQTMHRILNQDNHWLASCVKGRIE